MENNKLQIISVNAKVDKINYDSAFIPEQKSIEEGYPMDIQQTVEVISCDYEKISVYDHGYGHDGCPLRGVRG